MWSFRGANEKNKLLLINYKKSLQYSDVNENTIKAYQKDVYGLMIWLQNKDIDTLEATVDDLSEYIVPPIVCCKVTLLIWSCINVPLAVTF